jgi:hypothetical protein
VADGIHAQTRRAKADVDPRNQQGGRRGTRGERIGNPVDPGPPRAFFTYFSLSSPGQIRYSRALRMELSGSDSGVLGLQRLNFLTDPRGCFLRQAQEVCGPSRAFRKSVSL